MFKLIVIFTINFLIIKIMKFTVPYAKAPLGEFRFREPQPLEKWKGTKDGCCDPPPCLQTTNFLDSFGEEDCLYLTIYVPKVKIIKRLPVYVYIHGGLFLMGDTTQCLPDYLMENENIIYVTNQYRLGIFGFLSTADANNPGNWGLKDQISALKFIKRTICHFGGDHSRITIGGIRAGATAVGYLLQSPAAKSLFKRAILGSGSQLSLWGYSRKPKEIACPIAIKCGITNVPCNPAIIVDRFRRMDAKLLYECSKFVIAKELLMDNMMHGMPFAPAIEPPNDHAVFVERSHELIKNQEFNDVDIMLGFASEEGNYLRDIIVPYFAKSQIERKRLIPVDMNVNKTSETTVANQIFNKYFGGSKILDYSNSVQLFDDIQFVVPITNATWHYSRKGKTYLYEFAYKGVLVGGDANDVVHSKDMEYLCKTDNNKDKLLNATDQNMRDKLISLWTNFIITGNPTPNEDPKLDNVTWPLTDDTLRYLNIDSNLKIQTYPHKEYATFWHTLYNKYGNPPYNTY